jgi:hypothetical protein
MRVASSIAVLEVPNLVAFLSFKIEEFHVDLHVVPRYLLLIANRAVYNRKTLPLVAATVDCVASKVLHRAYMDQ